MQTSSFRLSPEARFVRDLGYVFIDVGGRIFRLDAKRFEALREACLRGLTPEEEAELAPLVEPCATRASAELSFRVQELRALHDF